MPKFIGIDHYFEASKLYQSLLTELCLPRIFHIEKLDDDPGKGHLESFKYKYPWTRIKADNDFLLEEAKRSDAALETLCENLPMPISSVYIKVGISQHSSPNKQHEEKQSFVPITLNHYRENLHLDHPCCLDEPLDVTEGLPSGPSLTFLLEKMKPLAVNDPFECDLKPDHLLVLKELEKCLAGMDQDEPKPRLELITGKLDLKMVDLPKENLFSFLESKKGPCQEEDLDSTHLSDNDERYPPSFCVQEFKENLVDRGTKVETTALRLHNLVDRGTKVETTALRLHEQFNENSLKNDQLEPSKEEANSDKLAKSLTMCISNYEATPMVQSFSDIPVSLNEHLVSKNESSIVGQCTDENGLLFIAERDQSSQPSTTAKHISKSIGLSSVQPNNNKPVAQNATLAKKEFDSFHSPTSVTMVQPKAEKLTSLQKVSSDSQKCNEDYSVIIEQPIISYQPSTMTQCNSESSSFIETQSFSDYDMLAVIKSMNNPEPSASAQTYIENKKSLLDQSSVENIYPIMTHFCSKNQDLDIKQTINIDESSNIVKSCNLKQSSAIEHDNQPSVLEYDVRDKQPSAIAHCNKENQPLPFEKSITSTQVSTMAEPNSNKQHSTIQNAVVRKLANTFAFSSNENQPSNIMFPGSKNSLTSVLQQNIEKRSFSTTSEVKIKSHFHDSKDNYKIHSTCDSSLMLLKTNIQEADSVNKLEDDQQVNSLKKESKSNTFNESKSERLDELLTNFIMMRKGKLSAKNVTSNQEANLQVEMYNPKNLGDQEMKSKRIVGETLKSTVDESSSVWLSSVENEVEKQNNSAPVSLKIKQSCSPKSQIKTVYLNGYYEVVAQLMNAYASPVIEKLRAKNLEFLPLQSGLVGIDPDRTRFCLNQKLKECQDKNEEPTLGGLETSICCQLLALHGYVKALECLLNCELSVSISCLKEFENTHHHILEDHFKNLLQDMKKLQCKVKESNTLHPKVIEIQAFVGNVMLDRKCSAKAKILIVVKRNFGVVSGILKCALKRFQDMNIILVPTEMHMDLEKVLFKTNR
ncbi:uncharacterized protein LOC106462063 isoform X2 [Limulus polyphemus]|uniref:Uncharacterized protein LOC106462063 isoform X2 n=1 Tax=Limulus polyphemus TaxID=6850 RepID=A0ABM1SMP3_LIMPO|nr:uncharacterized protein LOC106462063 isoform X2 [Limulus polyphemus]